VNGGCVNVRLCVCVFALGFVSAWESCVFSPVGADGWTALVELFMHHSKNI